MTIATPRTWVVGEVVSAAEMNAEIRDQWNDLIAGWTSFTPAWTSTGTAPSLGNGTILGRHKLVGKMATVTFEQVMGSTTTFGTGNYAWSLPFTAASPGGSSANFSYLGSARGHGTAWYHGVVGVQKGGNVARIYSHNGSTEWNPSTPFTWTAAATSYLQGEVTYEVA